MSSPSLTGLSPNTPNKYLGPNVSLNIIVTRKRAPTSADIKQPETGRYYSFGTMWMVGKNPTTGIFGDYWYLAKIEANVATWVQVGSSDGDFIAGDDGIPLSPTDDTWNIIGQKAGAIPIVETNGTVVTPSTLSVENRAYTTAFVVDQSTTPGLRGTFSTIQSAIDAASTKDVVFIRPGLYIEDLNLKSTVNLVAYGSAAGNSIVTIRGKISFSDTGIVTISGIRLQNTGSDFCLSVTGSNSSRVNLINCRISANFNAIQLASSTAGSYIRLIYTWFESIFNSAAAFTVTGAGDFMIFGCNCLTTATTVSSSFTSTGSLVIDNSNIKFPITCGSSANFNATNSEFDTSNGNRKSLIINSNGGGLANVISSCAISSGTAVAMTVNNQLTLSDTAIFSTNAIPIDGSGTLTYSGISFTGGTTLLPATTLTLVRNPFDAGASFGNFSGIAPAVGYVGQSIFSIIADTNAVALTSTVAVAVTSITLTPGTWDISAIVMFTGLTTTTRQNASIGTGSGVIASGSYGDSTISATFSSTTVDDVGLSIPSFRFNATVNTTIFLNARSTFSVSSSPGAYGRISATRVC